MPAFDYFSLPQPTIFAHRGSSAYAPENTLSAFELAITHHADAIEFDVKLSADAHVVVIHDKTVDRTTDGQGAVRSLSLAELKKLDAGSYFDNSFQGERIPTLDEVLAILKGKIFINIELPISFSLSDSLPEKVASIVQRCGVENQVLFSSFNPFALVRVHRHLPGIPIALLAKSGWLGCLARSRLGFILKYHALHPNYREVDERLVQMVKKRHARIHAYTVNKPTLIRRMLNAGVNGIFTDDPILAREVKDSISQK